MDHIIQWNIRGCVYHYSDLKMLLAEYDPICTCLQETHFKPGQAYALKKYSIVRKDADPLVRVNGGVAILVRQDVGYRQVPLNTDLQVVAVRMSAPFIVTICNIYLPSFTWDLADIQNVIRQLPTPFVLLGDFNAHNPLWGSTHVDQRGRILEDLLDDPALVLLNTGSPTYFNARSRDFSCIDLSILSSSLATRYSWRALNDLHGSDHFPLIITTDTPKCEQVFPPRWLTHKADWPRFTSSLKIPILHTDPNVNVEELTQSILSAASSAIPLSKSSAQRKVVPWWNKEVEELVRKKKMAFNRFKRYPSEENLISFKRARAVARRSILESKRTSWHRYVSGISSDTSTQECWSRVKRVAGHGSPTGVTCLRVDDETYTRDPLTIADIMANQFQNASSTTNYNADFRSNKADREVQLDFSSTESLYYNVPFQLLELDHALGQSKSSSPGPDQVTNDMLKHLTLDFKTYLLSVYNQLWEKGIYPEKWKEAIIVPIPKVGKDLTLPSSHRPISLTSCIGKIYERMVNNRLMWILESSNFLSEHQAGFRKFRSTIDHLVYLEDAILTAFNNKEHLVAVFFDLEKAYDMTWRYGILKKLHDWGFRGNLPLVLTSFLANRKFRVRVGTSLSSPTVQENGVPQGSTLSVTLFAIAVNELVSSVCDVGICLYVDDLTIFCSASKMGDINKKLQSAINIVVRNADELGFKLSREKTQCIHFCRLNRPHYGPLLFIRDSIVRIVNIVRFLGLIFDSRLTWKPHIEKLRATCLKALNVIKMLAGTKWGAESKVLLRVYQSLILSKIDYGCMVYASAKRTTLNRLDPVHNQALRYSLGAFPSTPTLNLYSESGLTPLDIRRKKFTLLYVNKIHAMPQHKNFNVLFKASNWRNRRQILTKPVALRSRELLEIIHLDLPPSVNLGQCEVAPWSIPTTHTDLTLSCFDKSDTPPVLIKSNFQQILHDYRDAVVIYTDGSKTEQGTGCAFFANNQSHSWSLPSLTSIYTAESYAIWQALCYCELETSSTKFLVVSDSRSVLQAILNTFTVDPIIQNILSLMKHLHDIGKDISFLWVPSHIGIQGNEMADEAARHAAANVSADVSLVKPSDIALKLKREVLSMWQSTWDGVQNHLKSIKPSVQPVSMPQGMDRRSLIKIHRLRMGHTSLTHGYRLNRSHAPVCERCSVTVTVHHILITCPQYNQMRQLYGIDQDIQNILTDHGMMKSTLEFLKAVNILHKI